MVAAFVMQMLTLFILVKDSDSYGQLSVSLPSTYSEGWTHGTYWMGDPEKTGFQARPLSLIVLPVLFLIFTTKTYERAWWRKHGYWTTVGIMLFFTTYGAMFREFGGFINISAFFIAIAAAFMHRKWLKANPSMPDNYSTSANIAAATSEHDQSEVEPVLTSVGSAKKGPPPLPSDETDLLEGLKGLKRSVQQMNADRRPAPRRTRKMPPPMPGQENSFFEDHDQEERH